MTEKNYARMEPEQLRWFNRWFFLASASFLRLMLVVKYGLRVEGLENVPRHSNFVCAANHVSGLDPPIMGASILKPMSFMAKRELFETPLGGWYFSHIGTFAVNREQLEKSTIKSALTTLKHGWNLGIFPEGTRSKSGEMGEMKRGAAYLAHSAGVPIVPMAIAHLDKNGKKRIRVKIGPAIPSGRDLDAVTEQLQAAVAGMLDELKQAEK